MHKLSLFNTESKKIQAIEPLDGHTLRLYTCGPTIYHFAHIGNFRTYVFEDLLRRTLKAFGYRVEQVMNLTDIDDKTIRGALAKNISLHEYTEPYREAFFADCRILGIEPVEHNPAATEYIPAMIAMIEKLLASGHAYRGAQGSIYFAIESFPSYGRLSHLRLSDLKMNASGSNEADEYEKENASDFVLWKAYDAARDGAIYWDSPFGKGRPGWHIECSAMATSLLGQTIDIHCGGVDNMFPHHENEIAQSECVTGRLFVRHWVHVEHLLVDQKKMSKSLGNFYTLRDLLQKGYTGREVRYLLLSVHYRASLNFTFAGLDGARAALERLDALERRLRTLRGDSPETHELMIQIAAQRFQEALAEDLNISLALAVLFEWVREVNILCDQNRVGSAAAVALLQLFTSWNQILALASSEEEIPECFLHRLREREVARKEKNFLVSDAIRQELALAGYLIEDTPQGARLKKSIAGQADS